MGSFIGTGKKERLHPFQIEDVPEGEYLILYESGAASFDEALDKWGGKRIGIGDFSIMKGDLFQGNPYGSFTIYTPEGGERSGFYYWHIEFTLAGGSSPFFVAHDIEAALSTEYTHGMNASEGIFVPTVLRVVQGYTSYVEFDVMQGKFGD